MPETDRLVINTGPLIALVAARGDLTILPSLYNQVKEGHSFSIQNAIQRMRDRGIWLSEQVIAFALEQAGEQTR
jgi:hypothetical protein